MCHFILLSTFDTWSHVKWFRGYRDKIAELLSFFVSQIPRAADINKIPPNIEVFQKASEPCENIDRSDGAYYVSLAAC